MTNSEIYRQFLDNQSDLEFEELPTPNRTSNEELYLYCLCKMLAWVIHGPDKYIESARVSAAEAKESEEHCEEILQEVKESSGVIPATSTLLGVVKPDGDTIVVDDYGVISTNTFNFIKTLPAGETTVEVVDPIIIEDEIKRVEFFSNTQGVYATEDPVVEGNKLVVKFNAQTKEIKVQIVIFK